VLVEFSQPRYTLFDLSRVEVYLEGLFGRMVDVIPTDSIKPHAEPDIRREIQYAALG
jgi:predicted nucleotidyltransferase